ncbi:MAG: nucleotidyltransferase domain-containing protein [Candidatus Nanoarchaeia archaeon]
MAKEKKQKEEKVDPLEAQLAALPPDVKKKIDDLKAQLEKFKKEVLKKFDKYITGIAIVPPPLGKDGKPVDSEKVHILVMVDDSDSKKMSKYELKNKLSAIIADMGKKISDKFVTEIVIHSEFWQNCYDGKYDLLSLIAMSAPVFDTGILSAIKLGEVHKSMVIKKFEKYIVSYVLFGSLTRGEATPESDIDVAIIVDDTDVKKMTRAELRDKLRAIIISMGMEASHITGIKKSFNIQVYILTEFWESVKEATPVIFTVLRDGVPFYDRGMFMPWKQLLKMGRIKPSREAIDMFMSTGDQMISRTRRKLLELVEADIYWSTLTPTQAALMMYGLPAPTPKETIELVEEIFVKKEKLLEKKYVDIIKLIRQYYKKLEHGELKQVSGKEVDDLINKADDYLKRIKKLFGELEILKLKESIIDMYDSLVTVMRDLLVQEGLESVPEGDLVKMVDEKFVSTGKLGARVLTLYKSVMKAKKEFDAGKLTKTGVEKAKKDYRELYNMLVEHMQRTRAMAMDRAKIRVKHGKKYGEVLLFEKEAFIILDIDAKEKEIERVELKEGKFGKRTKSTIEDLEKALAKMELPPSVFIKSEIFEGIQEVFGETAEILVNRV